MFAGNPRHAAVIGYGSGMSAMAMLTHSEVGPRGLPEEYAGLVTTTSFLYRYNSTSSNRNRGRAHRFYKFFLGKDVMKSAPRCCSRSSSSRLTSRCS